VAERRDLGSPSLLLSFIPISFGLWSDRQYRFTPITPALAAFVNPLTLKRDRSQMPADRQIASRAPFAGPLAHPSCGRDRS
jgi:hypothetical protein